MKKIEEIIQERRVYERTDKGMRDASSYQKRALTEESDKGYFTASPLNDDRLEYPFSVSIHPLPKPYGPMKLFHNHDFFELVYVYRGNCHNCYADYEICMKEKDLLLLNPDAVHCVYTLDPEDVVFNFLIPKESFKEVYLSLMSSHIISNFVMNYLYQMHQTNDYLIIEGQEDSPLYRLLNCLIEEYFNKLPGYEVILESGMAQALAYMARIYSEQVSGDAPYPATHKLSSLLLYIYKNYATVTLKEVAYTFSYNEKYLSRLFRKELHIGFSELIQQVRLQHAVSFLKKTNLTVEQIAGKVGYQNLTHFYQIFQETFHVTPAEYRKREEEKGQI